MNKAKEGGTLDFDDGDDQWIFLGRKIWQVFFWVAGLSRNFFWYSKQSEDSWYCCLCWMHSSANKVSPNFLVILFNSSWKFLRFGDVAF